VRVQTSSIPSTSKGRIRRVRQNLEKGMALAWSASPTMLMRGAAHGQPDKAKG